MLSDVGLQAGAEEARREQEAKRPATALFSGAPAFGGC